MDERAEHYRERAAELRKKIALSTSDETMRKGLLEDVAHYEQLARVIDAITLAAIHPKPSS